MITSYSDNDLSAEFLQQCHGDTILSEDLSDSTDGSTIKRGIFQYTLGDSYNVWLIITYCQVNLN